VSRIEHLQTLGQSLAAHSLVVGSGGNISARDGERNVPGFWNPRTLTPEEQDAIRNMDVEAYRRKFLGGE
jgi:ribulose-5-phosphate 4-epimerase/fuculose-1-phosphate aldolase